jgi:hypothetical protein
MQFVEQMDFAICLYGHWMNRNVNVDGNVRDTLRPAKGAHKKQRYDQRAEILHHTVLYESS